MVRALVDMALGPLGVQVLKFYTAHSLIINGAVIAYGLVVLASWRNLVGIRKQLVGSMIGQLKASGGAEEGLKVSQVLSRTTIPWQLAIGKVRFPWVAPQMGLWPKRATLTNVQEMLARDVLAGDVIEELTGARPIDVTKAETRAIQRTKSGRRRKR